MNKDEALRCLDISRSKLAQGDKAGALKFCKKSLSLCETSEGLVWMKKVEEAVISTSSNTTDANGSTATDSTATSRTSSSSSFDMNSGSTSTSTSSSKTTSFSSHTTSATKRKPVDREHERPQLPYTPEHVAGIKKIRAKKGDLYGILGLEKDCKDSEIKKAYRKLALQYHPDKCGAPGTDEAFKLISHSFAVLSDPDKRDTYDRYGVDPDSRASAAASGAGGGFHGHPFMGRGTHFGQEISPEELFEMFFGGAFGGGGGFQPHGFRTATFNMHPNMRRRYRHQAQQQQHQQEEGGEDLSFYVRLVQLLPLLILVLFSFMGSLFSSSSTSSLFGSSTTAAYYSDNNYAFMTNPPFTRERVTQHRGVKYFVTPIFDSQYLSRHSSQPPLDSRTKSMIKDFETRIEKRWLNSLHFSCQNEHEVRSRKIADARGWFGFGVDKEKMKEAEGMEMKSCKAYQELRKKF